MSIHSNDDENFLRDALPAFISESVELLDQLEQLLLELEDRPTDRELLDALFRCAHTIKGSAGLFGLDEIVAFTHHVETFLDALREGKTHLSARTSAVLLQSGDQIRRLITLVDPGRRATDAEPDIEDQRDTLIAALVAALPAGAQPNQSAAHPVEAAGNATSAPTGAHRIALGVGEQHERVIKVLGPGARYVAAVEVGFLECHAARNTWRASVPINNPTRSDLEMCGRWASTL